MIEFTYQGYQITIFETYYGDKVFIQKEGIQLYAHRVHKGDALNRVNSLLTEFNSNKKREEIK